MPADNLHEDSRLIGILRGLTPERAVAVGAVLSESGFRILEVPLNSPEPFASIGILAASLGAQCVIGAGTVLTAEHVMRTHAAGGRLIVAPNCDPEVIACALELGMNVMPGVATATEAFAAIRAGATHLKLFPASVYGAAHLKALNDVLPAMVRVFPVGGIGAEDLLPWLQAGAAGFGFGSQLFRADYSLEEIERRARHLIQAFRTALNRQQVAKQ
jgi:2-dehydro-3-deoxyphosphogalactonate aldolase